MTSLSPTLVKTALIVASVSAVCGGAVALQHGHWSDPDAHFEILAERLELTPEQRESLATPFKEAFGIFEEFHRLHSVIAAGLTEAQKDKLATMIHDMLGGAHDAGHEAGRHGH